MKSLAYHAMDAVEIACSILIAPVAMALFIAVLVVGGFAVMVEGAARMLAREVVRLWEHT